MKKLITGFLTVALLLPASAWAQWTVVAPVSDVIATAGYGSVVGAIGAAATAELAKKAIQTAAINGAIAASTTAITANQVTQSALLLKILYELDGNVGTALALTGATPTLGTAAVAQVQQTAAVRNETEMMREELVRPGKFPSIKEIIAKFRAIRNGDYQKITMDGIQKKIRASLEKMAEQFSEKALEEMAANALEDILSCQVPSLDMITPSFNLDFGITFCDYGQLVKDMKEQTKTLSDRSWGGILKVNGTDASELFKKGNGGLLKNAIQKTSPSVGHTLALDFMSDLSSSGGIQVNADMSDIGRKMGQDLRRTKPLFAPRNTLDGLDTVAKVTADGANLVAAGNKGIVDATDKGNQIKVIEAKAAERERERLRTREFRDHSADNLSF